MTKKQPPKFNVSLEVLRGGRQVEICHMSGASHAEVAEEFRWILRVMAADMLNDQTGKDAPNE